MASRLPERTQVGIAEWARRARGSRAVELQLADALGRAIPSATDGRAKAALAAEARCHGWHAELWDRVVPVLHDLDEELASIDGLDDVAPRLGAHGRDAAVVTVERLTDVYRAWRAEATRIADAPVIRVLDLVLRDHDAQPLDEPISDRA